jgi:hypothetical protein
MGDFKDQLTIQMARAMGQRVVQLRGAGGRLAEPLPMLCMSCGEPATQRVRQSFGGRDWRNAGFTMEVPCCDKHRVFGVPSHRAETIIVLSSLGVVPAYLVLLWVVRGATGWSPSWAGTGLLLLAIASAVGLVGGGLVFPLIRQALVRDKARLNPFLANRDGITFVGVPQNFEESLEELRRDPSKAPPVDVLPVDEGGRDNPWQFGES